MDAAFEYEYRFAEYEYEKRDTALLVTDVEIELGDASQASRAA